MVVKTNVLDVFLEIGGRSRLTVPQRREEEHLSVKHGSRRTKHRDLSAFGRFGVVWSDVLGRVYSRLIGISFRGVRIGQPAQLTN